MFIFQHVYSVSPGYTIAWKIFAVSDFSKINNSQCFLSLRLLWWFWCWKFSLYHLANTKRSISLFLCLQNVVFWGEIIRLNKEIYLDSLFQSQSLQLSFLLILLRPLYFHISYRNISIIEVSQLLICAHVSSVNKIFFCFQKK